MGITTIYKMKHTAKIITLAMALLPVVLACSHHDKEEENVARCAHKFAYNFFNFRYVDAMEYVNADSKRVLEFCASNMSRKIIDSLKNLTDTPSVSVENVEITNDSEAECRIKVGNEINFDTIGSFPIQTRGEITYRFRLVKEGTDWKIKMASPPRNEK